METKKGHPDSLFEIGNTFDDRSYDKVSAYMWYWLVFKRSKPELSVHKFIVSALEHIKTSDLKPTEIKEAVKLAEKWEKQYPSAVKSCPTDDYVENLTQVHGQLNYA